MSIIENYFWELYTEWSDEYKSLADWVRDNIRLGDVDSVRSTRRGELLGFTVNGVLDDIRFTVRTYANEVEWFDPSLKSSDTISGERGRLFCQVFDDVCREMMPAAKRLGVVL